MRFLFCADPWNKTIPDTVYQAEVEAARLQGLTCSLIDFETLIDGGDSTRAVRRVEPSSEQVVAIYRGWMLKPEIYERLYMALVKKNIYLINSPTAYRHCHYLPGSYHIIKEMTPLSIWLHTVPHTLPVDLHVHLQIFGDKPVLVKDFVKSQKHEWFDACYISSAANQQEVERVVRRFLQLQGEDLNEGLVFREFVELEQVGSHTKSAMPLSKEFRLFFLDGELLLSTIYWEEGIYEEIALPLEQLGRIARRVQSRFFTMDVALDRNGIWHIIELGDGQVAGLPERVDASLFYKKVSQNGI